MVQKNSPFKIAWGDYKTWQNCSSIFGVLTYPTTALIPASMRYFHYQHISTKRFFLIKITLSRCNWDQNEAGSKKAMFLNLTIGFLPLYTASPVHYFQEQHWTTLYFFYTVMYT